MIQIREGPLFRPTRVILTAYGLAATLAVAAVAACTHEARPGGDPYQVTTDYLPATANPKLDLLVMLGNENSTEPQRFSFIQYFPILATALADRDLHIGIITSNMGAGVFTPPSCPTIGGDHGMLQNQRHGMTCTTAGLIDPDARFLTYVPADDGGVPAVNFTGTLSDAFACHAMISEGSCHFLHQLASVRAALEGCDTAGGCTQPANEGFLRPDANLAIVILTDEDDCSAPPESTLFDPSQSSLDSVLGPLTAYRCFEFGDLCGGVDPGRQQGPRGDCVPGNKDPDPLHQLIPVEDFAAFLKALKPDLGSLYVAVIGGPPRPVKVGLDANGYPDLMPSCMGGMGSADPALRLAKLVTLLPPARGRFFSTCQGDLGGVETGIASDLNGTSTCLTGWLRNGIPGTVAFAPECVVVDRAPTGEEQVVPPCDPVLCEGDVVACECLHQIPAGAPGCWFVWADTECLETSLTGQPLGSGLRLGVDRGADATAAVCTLLSAPGGTITEIQCGTCAARPERYEYDCSAGCADYWPRCCPLGNSGCWP